MEEHTKKSKKLYNDGRIILEKIKSFISQITELFIGAVKKVLTAYVKSRLLRLNELKVRHFISVLDDENFVLKRKSWYFVPKNKLYEYSKEVIDYAFEKLEITKDDVLFEMNNQIQSKSALLLSFKLILYSLSKKIILGFGVNLTDDVENILRRFNIRLDDENIIDKIQQQIKNIERDLNRIKATHEQLSKSKDVERTESTSEAIMSLLYTVNPNANREMYLSDFFVIYKLFKANEKQNRGNLQPEGN